MNLDMKVRWLNLEILLSKNMPGFLSFDYNTWVRMRIAAQKMKFSIKDFFGKCDQIRSFLRI